MGKSVMMSTQHASRILPLTILGQSGAVAGVPELGEGFGQATVANGAAGVYVVTFANAFARVPVIVATAVVSGTGVSLFPVIYSVTAAGFSLEVTDDAGTLTEADAHVVVFGTDSADLGGV